jgi:hypothetical protein
LDDEMIKRVNLKNLFRKKNFVAASFAIGNFHHLGIGYARAVTKHIGRFLRDIGMGITQILFSTGQARKTPLRTKRERTQEIRRTPVRERETVSLYSQALKALACFTRRIRSCGSVWRKWEIARCSAFWLTF